MKRFPCNLDEINESFENFFYSVKILFMEQKNAAIKDFKATELSHKKESDETQISPFRKAFCRNLFSVKSFQFDDLHAADLWLWKGSRVNFIIE